MIIERYETLERLERLKRLERLEKIKKIRKDYFSVHLLEVDKTTYVNSGLPSRCIISTNLKLLRSL
jgi:hypothetical protein